MNSNNSKLELNDLIDRNISDEMRTSFLDYSMSVIVSRALPDARDGLKPVHRRILYALNNLGMTHDKPHKKSARIVGEIIGKYHPHGDIAVYDAMVRMAQEFSYRYPLIDGHGNFGSIDGDKAAAMRYTEARMSKIASEIVKDLNKRTVAFKDNYDGAEKEPTVLPSYFPNLLANGASGIAVGMATSIPPHNLNEIVDAIIYVANNPECDVLSILDYIKGPDFPTGAIILGQNSFKNAYLTGKATIKVRSKTHVEALANNKVAIIIDEIPYQIKKASLIENIVEKVQSKQVQYITDLRDESNREGLRIVLELKNASYQELVLNQLYKYTKLQDFFNINLVALEDNQPKLLNLKQIITIYINHQIKMIKNKSQYELEKCQTQAHIASGLLVAIDNIHLIINIIKNSKTTEEAKLKLITDLHLSEEQVKAILDMKLQRLTGLEKIKLLKEVAELKAEINNLESLLASFEKQIELLLQRLTEIKEKYGDERRTEILENFEEDIIDEALIKEEDVVISLSKNEYVKRIPLEVYRTQNRGGVGVKATANMVDKDEIDKILVTSTHSDLLFFTNKGKVYRIRAHKVPVYSRTAKGLPVINLISKEKGEKVKAIINLNDHDYEKNGTLFFVTKKGIVKRTNLKDFKSIRNNGKIALKLSSNDQLIDVVRTNGENEIIIAASNGRVVRFNEQDVRLMSRSATGVKGMTVEKAEVVGICTNMNTDLVLSVSERGYGKITPFNDYRLTKRGSKGVKSMKTTVKTGALLTIKVLNSHETSTELLVVTLKGLLIRLSLENIRATSRNTSGVKLIRLKHNDDAIASVETIFKPTQQ